MKSPSVLKWMINLTLLAILIAGAVGIYFWKHSDELARRQVQVQFEQLAPELKLILGSAQLHGADGVSFRDVEIQERATSRPLFRARELHIDINSDQLLNDQQLQVEHVRLKSADILLTRMEDGRWNWQQYSWHLPENRAGGLPQIDLQDVRIQLTLQHGHGIPAAHLLVTSPQMQAVPTSSHGFDFDGAITLPGAGLLKLGGMGDLMTGDWQLGGKLTDVQASEQLMDLARAANPGLENQLQMLDAAIEKALPQQGSQTAAAPGAALQIGSNSRVAVQFLGLLDINFNASGNRNSPIPDFQLRVGIRNGRLASAALPLRLNGVTASLYRDNQNIEFRLDDAEGDGAKISGNLLISHEPGAGPPAAMFRVERFPVNNRLRPILATWPRILRIFDSFSPEGVISGQGRLVQQTDGRWKPVDVTAEIHQGTAVYHRFQYPVQQLAGTIRQVSAETEGQVPELPQFTADDLLLELNVHGKVGDVPLVTEGWLKNPGPTAESLFICKAADFPLDSRFQNALEDKQRRILDSLNLTGTATGTLRFYRPPGLDQITQPTFDLDVFNATMRFEKFPYDITDLSGHVMFDGARKKWTFAALRGRHGQGQLTAEGVFEGTPEPGVLDLTIRARQAALDADLYNALSEKQRRLWNMVAPEGFCDLTTQIHWTASPGQSAVVSFPQSEPVRIYNTKIRPQPFPFNMLVQEATLFYDPNDPRNAGTQHCEILSFHALHDDSPMKASGWLEAKPDGEWQVHLNEVSAEDLNPDEHLRAALPPSWREALNRIHEQGTVSVADSQIDFRGDMTGQRSTTARWNMNLLLRDCTIDAGLDVSHVYGQLSADGWWDGLHLQNTGTIQLETAEVLDMPLTGIRGPYSIDDVELVLGARKVFEPNSPLNQVDRSTRMTGVAYGGQLLFDARVDMREGGQYQLVTELENARLESYAALHVPDQKNLRGVVAAWMFLQGYGDEESAITGSGQMRISPAALYELPVIVKLLGSLSQLNLNVQNLTAFNYAIMDFEVHDKAFWLNPVDLVGESISFRGRGSVDFSGAVDMDFYSRPARTRSLSIPFISGIFTNWAKIEVRGTTDRPHVKPLALGQLDEGMKQFLQPFNPNPQGPVPLLAVPRFLPRTEPLFPRAPLRNTGMNRAGLRQ
ncbi:MAG: hypothetical protein R3C49_07845 [Planctomycetaceae bacterium]